MTYEDLISLLAIKDGFDVNYTINNLSVKEVFYNDYILNSSEWFNWSDIADKSSIEEVRGIITK